jgi:hypothetical protein
VIRDVSAPVGVQSLDALLQRKQAQVDVHCLTHVNAQLEAAEAMTIFIILMIVQKLVSSPSREVILNSRALTSRSNFALLHLRDITALKA